MNGDDVNGGGRGYQAIMESLRRQIRAGHYLPGAFLPTERELQETFKVSRSTVRRALSALAESGWAEVKPKRGVAAKIGPVSAIGGNVAYIDHADLVDQRLFFELGRLSQSKGFHLIHVDSRSLGVEGAMEYAADQGFIGAFVWSKSGFPDAARVQAVQARLPLVALDHELRSIGTDLVTEDNAGGARTVVGHVASLGRKRIAVSGMMDMLEVNHERFSGYLQALFDHDLKPAPRDYVFCLTSGSEEPDTLLLERRLKDPDRPDAIFVLQDMLVPPVVEAIFKAGLRIPEDVAVVAFGGEAPIKIGEVGLTTVVIDWDRFTAECVRVLEARIQNPRAPFGRTVVPVSLTVRGSCGG